MNFDRVARHDGKHRRIQEIAQNAETENVSIIIGGSHDIGNDELRRNHGES